MKILLLEDDHLQADSLCDQLERGFPNAVIDHVQSEQEFRSRIPTLEKSPPDVAILDVMVRWTDPQPDMEPPPEDVATGGHYRAGLRCHELLRKANAQVPVVLYSVLDPADYKPDMIDDAGPVVTLGKDTDAKRLIRVIRGLTQQAETKTSKSIFVVHGHDDEAKESVARFIEKMKLEAIVLHEQPSLGKTIIEKFEKYANVRFAVVLLTPDDVGGTATQPKALQPRARQNVIFELGFFVAKLGRRNVCALYKEDVEIPSDIQGILYVPMDRNGGWRWQLAREMQAAGLPIDASKLL